MADTVQLENQRQFMEDAFMLFLNFCRKSEKDEIPFEDIKPINTRLKTVMGQDTSLYDMTTVEQLEKAIGFLKESGMYDKLTNIESEESEDEKIQDYTKVIDAYRDFLVSYQFAKVWTMPRELDDEDVDGVAKNTIVYGAPGTGKSHFLNELSKKNKAEITRTTFHPDMDYSSFVGCYKPFKDEDGEITYEFVPQSFTTAYVNAWHLPKDKPYYLIIEEINRGNCSQIFGDLFQLLDRDSMDMSKFAVTPDTDLAAYLRRKLADCTREDIPEKVKTGKELRLPGNLWLLATMNTSDQSLYPMDSAFKRRWEWKYIPLERGIPDKYIKIGDSFYSWGNFLEKINAKIAEATQSEDKKLGFWFVQAEDNIISIETFVNKVLFYLWNDIYKDRQYDDRSPFSESDLKFHSFYKSQNKLNGNAVKLFLDKMEVPEETDIQSIYVGEETESNGGGKLRVTYNGRVYDYKKAVDVFVEVIEAIGVDKVKRLSDEKYNGKWVITEDVYENGDTDKRRYRKTSNGMYLHVGLSNASKQSRLETIGEDLELVDMKIELQ